MTRVIKMDDKVREFHKLTTGKLNKSNRCEFELCVFAKSSFISLLMAVTRKLWEGNKFIHKNVTSEQCHGFILPDEKKYETQEKKIISIFKKPIDPFDEEVARFKIQRDLTRLNGFSFKTFLLIPHFIIAHENVNVNTLQQSSLHSSTT